MTEGQQYELQLVMSDTRDFDINIWGDQTNNTGPSDLFVDHGNSAAKLVTSVFVGDGTGIQSFYIEVLGDFPGHFNAMQLRAIPNVPAGPGAFFTGDAEVEDNLPLSTELTLGATTYYFRTEFQFDGDAAMTALSLNTLVDDGAVFYLNGEEVYLQNMPAGPVAHTTLALEEVANPVSLTTDIPIPTEHLVTGTNLLAVELHTSGPADTDMLMGVELHATEIPLQSIEQIDVAFNEVPAASTDPFWVELVNNGDTELVLDGFVLASSTDAEYTLSRSIRVIRTAVTWCLRRSCPAVRSSTRARRGPPTRKRS
ncbi:hypothetical protein OAS39_06195 [Pirellulales bacterium]|nr:hypothetical protein [Pirellulales bacterium]